MEGKSELKVSKIKNGTVIDHIQAGYASRILNYIVNPEVYTTVVLGMYLDSKTMGKKDIIKFEGYLDEIQMKKLSLVADEVMTVNIIRDWEVVEKSHVPKFDRYEYIARCQNIGCVSNSPKERMKGTIIERENKGLKCHYCGWPQNKDKIYDNLIGVDNSSDAETLAEIQLKPILDLIEKLYNITHSK